MPKQKKQKKKLSQRKQKLLEHPISKYDVASLLAEIADIMEILGENPFKSRAHVAAARAIETLSGDLQEMVESGELLKVKGIGKGIFEKIRILFDTEDLPSYRELKARVPDGLLELLRIPGMGPKKVKAVFEKLEVTNIGELEYACKENRLSELDGFGVKSQDKILAGIQNLKKYMERHLLSTAQTEAAVIYDEIAGHPDVQRHLLAGSLRRFRETIKDIDILVSAKKSGGIMDRFVGMPNVESVLAQGETKSSVMLTTGINADIRVVTDREFPFAAHYFTGSKEHNTAMRGRAKKMGMKLNEYGLFKGEKLIPCKDEAEIFHNLGLEFIPPELREAMGEIEAAEHKELPTLLEESDIKGLFHAHTTYSDGKASLEEMAAAVKNLGFDYLGIADHSRSAAYAGGLSVNAVKKQRKEVDELNKSLEGFVVFHGIESDILTDGSLDYPEDVLRIFDFVIASVHSNFGLSETQMTERIIKAIRNPYTTMLGHPTGRLLLAREGYRIDMNAVIDVAAGGGVVIELNSHPHRLDIDWRVLRTAKEKGVKIAINPDSHDVDGLTDYRYGVGIARKGWLCKEDVINTMGTTRLNNYFKNKRKR
jgi:DNA polymerase (family 10)